MRELVLINKGIIEDFSFALCVLFFFVISVGYVNYAGIYHGELDVYLPHYLSDNKLLKIIFNPLCELDFTNTSFRGRELGSFFNWVDAKLLVLLVGAKFDVMVSIIFYVALIGTIFFIWRILKELAVPDKICKVLLLLFISMPPIVLSGGFYRTNKIISASFVLVTMLSVASMLVKHKQKKFLWANSLLLFSASAIAGLSDEQGFALIAVIFVYICGRWIIDFDKESWAVAGFPLLVSITLIVIYRLIIGPEVFFLVNGTYPVGSPGGYADLGGIRNISNAIFLMFRYTGYVFGSPNDSPMFVLVFLGFFYVYIFGLGDHNKIISRNFPLILPILMLVYIFSLMTNKHPAVYWPDIIGYYSLPFCFFVYGLFVLKCAACIKNGIVSQVKLKNSVWLFIVFNITLLPYYAGLSLGGHLRPFRVAKNFFIAVHSDESSKDIHIKRSTLYQLTPGAISFDLTKDGANTIWKLLK